MILPGVVVGAVFAFTASFDELMLSLFLTTPETNTLPRVIWAHLAYQLSPDIAAVATPGAGVQLPADGSAALAAAAKRGVGVRTGEGRAHRIRRRDRAAMARSWRCARPTW